MWQPLLIWIEQVIRFICKCCFTQARLTVPPKSRCNVISCHFDVSPKCISLKNNSVLSTAFLHLFHAGVWGVISNSCTVLVSEPGSLRKGASPAVMTMLACAVRQASPPLCTVDSLSESPFAFFTWQWLQLSDNLYHSSVLSLFFQSMLATLPVSGLKKKKIDAQPRISGIFSQPVCSGGWTWPSFSWQWEMVMAESRNEFHCYTFRQRTKQVP